MYKRLISIILVLTLIISNISVAQEKEVYEVPVFNVGHHYIWLHDDGITWQKSGSPNTKISDSEEFKGGITVTTEYNRPDKDKVTVKGLKSVKYFDAKSTEKFIVNTINGIREYTAENIWKSWSNFRAWEVYDEDIYFFTVKDITFLGGIKNLGNGKAEYKMDYTLTGNSVDG